MCRMSKSSAGEYFSTANIGIKKVCPRHAAVQYAQIDAICLPRYDQSPQVGRELGHSPRAYGSYGS